MPCLHPFSGQNLALPPGIQLKIELHCNMPNIIFTGRNADSVPIVEFTDIKLEFETFELENKIGDKLLMIPFNIDRFTRCTCQQARSQPCSR